MWGLERGDEGGDACGVVSCENARKCARPSERGQRCGAMWRERGARGSQRYVGACGGRGRRGRRSKCAMKGDGFGGARGSEVVGLSLISRMRVASVCVCGSEGLRFVVCVGSRRDESVWLVEVK